MRVKQKVEAGATLASPSAIPDLIVVTGGDAARLRDAIATEWGFVPTLAYCASLIAFVEKMLDGPRG